MFGVDDSLPAYSIRSIRQLKSKAPRSNRFSNLKVFEFLKNMLVRVRRQRQSVRLYSFDSTAQI